MVAPGERRDCERLGMRFHRWARVVSTNGRQCVGMAA